MESSLSPQRIAATTNKPLVVRLRNWVGEVVLGIPTLQLLQESGYQLHLIGRSWARNLLEGHDWQVLARPSSYAASIAQLRALRRELKDADPSFSRRINTVLLTTSFSSALETRLAGLNALGYASENRRWLLRRALPEPIRGRHVAVEYWAVGAALAGVASAEPAPPSLQIREARLREAQELLDAVGVTGRYAVLCPFSGAGDPQGRKRWPDFSALAQSLSEAGIQVLICPGPGEESHLASLYPNAIVRTKVPLALYAALMRNAWCTVAGDTGPGHLAAAAGAYLLSIRRPPGLGGRWEPLGSRTRVARHPERWPTVNEVMEQMPWSEAQAPR